MLEAVHTVRDWLLSLGPRYGVNAIIFAALYFGSIPFFFASLIWTGRRVRAHRPAFIPGLVTMFFFLSAYLYVLVFGHGLPWWAYAAMVASVLAGLVSIVRRVWPGAGT